MDEAEERNRKEPPVRAKASVRHSKAKAKAVVASDENFFV